MELTMMIFGIIFLWLLFGILPGILIGHSTEHDGIINDLLNPRNRLKKKILNAPADQLPKIIAKNTIFDHDEITILLNHRLEAEKERDKELRRINKNVDSLVKEIKNYQSAKEVDKFME